MREGPCPGRIMFELGDGFNTGCALGSIWYFAVGAYRSVRRERVIGGLKLLRNRAPILGGSFAMWVGVNTTTQCLLVYWTGRESPFFSGISGFVTGAVLASRSGFRSAMISGLFGGIFLTVFELVMIVFNKLQKDNMLREQKMMQERELMMIAQRGQGNFSRSCYRIDEDDNPPEEFRKVEFDKL